MGWAPRMHNLDWQKQMEEEGSTGTRVRIVSRRLVKPEPPAASSPAGMPSEPETTMHLTPWDLRMITIDYIQKGLLLPKPHPHTTGAQLVDSLASSLARALGCFYPLAGRLAVTEEATTTTTSGGPAGIVVSLCCNGEGAEFVHAVASPEVTVSDITTTTSPAAGGCYYIPSSLVWSFFPLNAVLGTDGRAVLAAQVTELADGVFIAMSLNHAVADGVTFWHLFNTWSEISRRRVMSGGGCCDDDNGSELSTPPPALDRWFLETTSVPVVLPFRKLEDIIRWPEFPPVKECFFHFSAESVKKLKEKANAEMAGAGSTSPPATVPVSSSLQSLLAHLWRASCHARELAPDRETAYTVLVGCRGRVEGVPREYVGNTVTHAVARSTAGEVLRKGLGWTAWLLNRAVAAFDEASVRSDLASWPLEPRFVYALPLPPSRDREGEEDSPATILTGSSPRFDVYGNDFGWGRPVGVRSGAGNKMDGKVTVYEGRGGGCGSMALEVCLSHKALARLVADEEFMEAVSAAGTS